jgi:cytoskeletal protein CcmA (bactofilin family)
MREERGVIHGNIEVEEKYTLWGTVHGDVRVLDGGKMYVRGSIYGDLIVEFGGRVHVFGQVSGNLVLYRGTKVINSGTIQGNAVNEGGRLFVDQYGTVLGKVKTNKGETHVEPKATMDDDEADGLM